MKVSKTRAEIKAIRAALLEKVRQRDELRAEAARLHRRVIAYRRRAKRQAESGDGLAEFCRESEKAVQRSEQDVIAKIRRLSGAIRRAKEILRYFDRNELDIVARDETAAFRLCGKKYRDMTKAERAEYQHERYMRRKEAKRKAAETAREKGDDL